MLGEWRDELERYDDEQRYSNQREIDVARLEQQAYDQAVRWEEDAANDEDCSVDDWEDE